MSNSSKIFENLFVLELSSVLAGPLVGTFLAELGAKVIKVENKKTGGDVTRTFKGIGESESSETAYFRSCNWGKESIFLDLKDKTDYENCMELAKNADIIISNFLPETAEKLGLGVDKIKSINPSVIFGQILGYTSKPNKPAYDMVLQAEAGYISMTGTRDGQHAKIPVPLLDILAAHQLKEGILLAFIGRMKDGKGRKVDVSLFDTAISSLTNQGANYLQHGTIPVKLGTRHPHIPIYGQVFESKDNVEFIVAAASDLNYRNIYEYYNFPVDLRAENAAERRINEVQIINFMQLKFRSKMFTEISEALSKLIIPFGEIRKIDQVFKTSDGQNLIELGLNNEDVGINHVNRVPTNIFKVSLLN